MGEFQVNGQWKAIQSNGFEAVFHLNQIPLGTEALTGHADHSNQTVHSKRDGVAGTVRGDQFFLRVEWDNGTTGIYEGRFGMAEGGRQRISGTSFDEAHPQSQATWHSDATFVR